MIDTTSGKIDRIPCAFNSTHARIGKAFGKHSIETVLSYVDAGVDYQGFNIGQQAIPEVIAKA